MNKQMAEKLQFAEGHIQAIGTKQTEMILFGIFIQFFFAFRWREKKLWSIRSIGTEVTNDNATEKRQKEERTETKLRRRWIKYTF